MRLDQSQRAQPARSSSRAQIVTPGAQRHCSADACVEHPAGNTVRDRSHEELAHHLREVHGVFNGVSTYSEVVKAVAPTTMR
jgi:hypothetical protein